MTPQYRLNLNELPACPFEFSTPWMPTLQLNEYPDPNYRALRQCLAAYNRVTADQIVCTNGSDELIGLAITTLTPHSGPASLVLFCSPTFGEYKRMADQYGRKTFDNTVTEPLEQRSIIKRLETLKQLWQTQLEPSLPLGWQSEERLPLLFLCSPNNPTGELLPQEVIEDCLNWFQGYIVLDEAYGEFSETSTASTALLEAYPKLLLLKTLSKANGLAGLRLGYGIGSEKLSRSLNDARPPYNINSLTETLVRTALSSLLSDDSSNQGTSIVTGIRGERETLMKALSQAGYICLPSQANFLLVKSPTETPDRLEKRLQTQGIQIRTFTAPELCDWIRITISTAEINKKVLALLTSDSLPPEIIPRPDTQTHPQAQRNRSATVTRVSKETDIQVSLTLEGSGLRTGQTGIGFMDHMLDQWLWQSGFDLELQIGADWHVDQHHALEDLGIVLGQCFKKALEPRVGLIRYGHSYVPMDESLTRVVADLSGRGHWQFKSPPLSTRIGSLETESLWEFFKAFATHSSITLHAEILYGTNSHHMVESLFKAFGRALGKATELSILSQRPLSTKGFID